MGSKKISSPLLSIFQQWIAQQQRSEVSEPSSPLLSSSSYRILLQTSYSLQTRISAAEPVENPHLYKNAGLATPSERASRDIYGGSETGWLLRLVELAVQQQMQSELESETVAPGKDAVSIIFVTTKARSYDYSIIQELPKDVKEKVQVIDLAFRDPFGWDCDDEKDDNDSRDNRTTTRANIVDLHQIYRKLQEEFKRSRASGAPVILIWQSLAPLILVHGFHKILRLLCALPTCLQVWPVNLPIMTPTQHAQLENVSNALLCMREGEMNIVRQGIRERGNILRQKVPFRLIPFVSDQDGQRRFRIVEETDCESKSSSEVINDNRNTIEITNRKNKKEDESNATEAAEIGRLISSHGSSGTSGRGTKLRLEENDGGRSESVESHASSDREVIAPNRPRIYLQDDDPEFDDFDEEDPDDDLEI